MTKTLYPHINFKPSEIQQKNSVETCWLERRRFLKSTKLRLRIKNMLLRFWSGYKVEIMLLYEDKVVALIRSCSVFLYHLSQNSLNFLRQRILYMDKWGLPKNGLVLKILFCYFWQRFWSTLALRLLPEQFQRFHMEMLDWIQLWDMVVQSVLKIQI